MTLPQKRISKGSMDTRLRMPNSIIKRRATAFRIIVRSIDVRWATDFFGSVYGRDRFSRFKQLEDRSWLWMMFPKL